MFGAALAILAFVGLWGFNASRRLGRFGRILLAGYGLRVIVSLFVRDLPLFQYGTGGDFTHYEVLGTWVSELWQRDFHYVTQADIPEIGPTSLPPNLFALVFAVNGGPTPLGATAIVALLAVLTIYMLYRTAVELGSDPVIAERIATLLLFSPAFFMYTSDCYKEGLVLFFVVLGLRSSLRLSAEWSTADAIFGAIATLGLFNVRFYLVFVTLSPLAVGLLGSGRSILRTITASLAVAGGSIAMFTFSPAVRDATNVVSMAFDTGATQIDFTAPGSLVAFGDAADPFSQIGLKIVYTLFAPFPWQGGSIGFQIGKLESILGYYLIYRSCISMRRLWSEDRLRLFMFLVFLVPTTVMYAASIYNIGLIVRERMPIMLVFGLLATLGFPAAKTASDEEGVEGGEGDPGDGSPADLDEPDERARAAA